MAEVAGVVAGSPTGRQARSHTLQAGHSPSQQVLQVLHQPDNEGKARCNPINMSPGAPVALGLPLPRALSGLLYEWPGASALSGPVYCISAGDRSAAASSDGTALEPRGQAKSKVRSCCTFQIPR